MGVSDQISGEFHCSTEVYNVPGPGAVPPSGYPGSGHLRATSNAL